MLKLNPAPTFTAPVKITVPGEDKPETLELTFKYRGKKEVAQFFEDVAGMEDVEAFKSFVEGWNWPDVEFSDENIETFLNNYPSADMEIAIAYRDLLIKSRVKN